MKTPFDYYLDYSHGALLTEAKSLGLTKNWLAESLHVNQKNIARWFQREDYPDHFHMAIAKIIIGVKVFGSVAIERNTLKSFRIIRRDGAKPEPSQERLRELTERRIPWVGSVLGKQ